VGNPEDAIGVLDKGMRSFLEVRYLLASRVFLLILTGFGQLGCASSTTEPVGASGNLKVQPVALSWIHMSTVSTGWALSGKGVLRSTDGGREWTKLRGLPLSARYPHAVMTAHGPNEAWVVALVKENVDAIYTKARVFSTTDAGRHWFRSRALRGYGESLDFEDSRRGWLFAGLGVATGSVGHNLYRTSDGGRNWKLIEYNHIDRGSKGSLNPCNGLEGTSFSTYQEGWSTGMCGPGPQLLMMYRSVDGGVHWHAQPLPWPRRYHVNFWNVALPAFTGSDGVLPVSLATPAAFVLYLTHDGGDRWFPTTPIKQRSAVEYPDAFLLDPQDVWAVVDGTLYLSVDTGSHWRPLSHHFNGGELDFITAQEGFALNVPGPTLTIQLFRTDDGGRSWRSVETVLAG